MRTKIIGNIDMKRSANLSVDAKLLEEAKSLDINLSQTLEQALRSLIRHKRSEQWTLDNKASFESYSNHIERRGAFSDKLRSF